MKIGIPKALLYYKYQYLWINFFTELGLDVVLSDSTNKQILNDGINNSIDEACLSMKIYMGHVNNLINKCDYILVPRIICLKKNEKLCTNFSALYDVVRNVFDVKIINYNIDVNKKETEIYAFLQMGKQLGFSYKKTLNAYYKAKRIENNKKQMKIQLQKRKLNSHKTKILLVAHPYNLYDELIGKPIINYLKKENIEIILSDIYDNKNLEEECSLISKDNYWTYSKELLGAISHYKKDINGIILITTFPCGPDSLTNEMCLRKIKDIPIINIIIDELSGESGLITRLESFVDILNSRKEQKDAKEKNDKFSPSR